VTFRKSVSPGGRDRSIQRTAGPFRSRRAFSPIAPNRCNDQHGRGDAGPACDFDSSPLGDGTYNDGSTKFLNPALIYQGDLTLRTLVKAIHGSKVWHEGRDAIVVVWDENDYSAVNNRVLVNVDTSDGDRGVHSVRRHTHFSLLYRKKGHRGASPLCVLGVL
jgi:hypothetical protein